MGGLVKMIGSCVQKDYAKAAENAWGLILGFKFFLENEVVVGITEETNLGREGGLNNAGLLYMHEQGVPSHNIPPRPVLQPAIAQDEIKERIELLMKDAAQAALVDGDVERAKANCEKAGMVGRDACIKYIMDGGNLAPNAPRTIARKRKKGKGEGDPIPLVDTGSMVGSITYAVRKKK